jgi:Phage tail lysozyme
MSGSGSDVLKEYMVKLTYQVNAASQASFVRSLVESATSSSQAASAMYRLGAAIAHMARGMAEAGDKLYWMGQRLQSSVQGIESATYAMTQLGSSASSAHASMEAMGNFARTYGPAATNYLRSIGITATDAGQRMEQLGNHLRSMGFQRGKEGTTGYAMGKQLASFLGVSEDDARAAADPEFARRRAEQRALVAKAGLNMDQQTASAQRLMNVFRQFDLLTDTVWKRFGQDVMPGLTKDFEHLYAVLYKHLPDITEFFNKMAKAILWVVDLFVVFVDTIDKLDATSIKMIEVFAGVLAAVRVLSAGLLASPLFWFIAGLTTLLLLIDDYNHWKEDQKDGKRTSAFDWSGFSEMKGSVDKFGEEWLHVCNLFEKILLSMGLLFAAPMLLGLGRTAAAVAGIGGAASGLLGFLMRIAPILALLSFVGPAGGENKEWSEEKNKEFLREREKHKNDPGFLDWAQKWIYDNLPDKTGPLGRSLNPYSQGSEGGQSTPPGTISTNTASGAFMAAQSGSKPSGQEVLEYLMSPQGGAWSNVQAAGIIGNLMQESGLDPNAKGDGGAAYGMAQWHPDRQALFQQRFGKPIQQASWREQIDFLNWELGHNESRAGNALRGASTIDTATMAALGMERPKDWDKTPAELNRRLPYARAALLPGSVSGQAWGSGGGGGVVGLPGGWQPGAPMGGAGGVTINQKTDINVASGPTAADTAARVAGAQTRVNQSLVRNTRSVLR